MPEQIMGRFLYSQYEMNEERDKLATIRTKVERLRDKEQKKAESIPVEKNMSAVNLNDHGKAIGGRDAYNAVLKLMGVPE